jgi:hypothetical protein
MFIAQAVSLPFSAPDATNSLHYCGKPIPRDQEPEVAPLIPVFDFFSEDHKFVLATLSHPVLTLGQ